MRLRDLVLIARSSPGGIEPASATDCGRQTRWPQAMAKPLKIPPSRFHLMPMPQGFSGLQITVTDSVMPGFGDIARLPH
jgi:hypothetical protein